MTFIIVWLSMGALAMVLNSIQDHIEGRDITVGDIFIKILCSIIGPIGLMISLITWVNLLPSFKFNTVMIKGKKNENYIN